MKTILSAVKVFSVMILVGFTGSALAKPFMCGVSVGVHSEYKKAKQYGQINGIVVKQAWQPAMPHSVPVNAGYLRILNSGDEAFTLSAIHSEQFANVEFHRTQHKNGIASMERVEALTIAPGETLSLVPQGLHLMMFRPKSALKDGDQYSVVLNTDKGESHCFVMTVGRCDQCSMAENQHDHSNHHSHHHQHHHAHASSQE